MYRILAFILLLTSAGYSAHAQPGWEAGGWLGATWFFGDINTQYDLGLPGAAAGLAGRYNFNERVAVKGSLGIAYLRGSDAVSSNIYEYARNLSFRTDLAEAAIQLEFNFLPYQHGNYEKYLSPYLLAGLSGMYYIPKAHYQGDWKNLRSLGTEGQAVGEEYSPFTGNILFGGGLKVDLSYRWSVNLEITSRIALSDYLDDVSTEYPDKQILQNERGSLAVALSDRSAEVDPATLPPDLDFSDIGQPGRQRGERNTNDSFVVLKVGIMYYFGQIRCPDPSAANN